MELISCLMKWLTSTGVTSPRNRIPPKFEDISNTSSFNHLSLFLVVGTWNLEMRFQRSLDNREGGQAAHPNTQEWSERRGAACHEKTRKAARTMEAHASSVRPSDKTEQNAHSPPYFNPEQASQALLASVRLVAGFD